MKERNESSGQEHKTRIYLDQLITVDDLNHFKQDLFNEIKNLLKVTSTSQTKKWLKSSEVKKLLGISTGTLQNLRVNGTLTFSKVGGIIFYDYADIVKLMESNGQG